MCFKANSTDSFDNTEVNERIGVCAGPEDMHQGGGVRNGQKRGQSEPFAEKCVVKSDI